MGNVEAPPPFAAYKGVDPFVFVSYAHTDGAKVFSDIEHLYEQGYRIWYDEGIDPGNEWPDDIAQSLAQASMALVFVSPAAVQSQNVRNEVYFALNREKRLVAVYLEETQLPPGLELRMGEIQAILKHRIPRDAYLRALAACLPGSVRVELRPRADLIANAHKVHVRVLKSPDQSPVKGAQVDLTLIDAMRRSGILMRAPAEPIASGSTDAEGVVCFGLLPHFIFGDEMFVWASARFPGFALAHARLEFRSPSVIARMTRDDKPSVVFSPAELRGIRPDESVLLELSPGTQ